MEQIKVLVNGIYDKVGAITARNVLRQADMYLLPTSITNCGFYRKGAINQVKINLIDPKEVNAKIVCNPIFGYSVPDVVVDFNPDSFFGKEIPEFLDAKTSFVLVAQNDKKDYTVKLTTMIEKLGVNIALLPENSSEAQILSVIRCLYQKNKANIFGQVISLEDIAA
jgi:hypothetical protein